MHVRSADADSPDGRLHAVPTNRWARLGFYHDGFAKMQLSIDGRVVGEKTVGGGVPSVQAAGVAIGNDIADGNPLRGDIDEISIWRLDPNEMRREFLCRHYSAKEARMLGSDLPSDTGMGRGPSLPSQGAFRTY
jgi:hypothetical protein